MIELRGYQNGAIDALLGFWADGGGNPLIDLATGTGKSLVIAELVRQVLEAYPDMRVLVLVHVKELVKQNADAMLKVWPSAPIGINAASLGQRDTLSRILFASIQSVYRQDGWSLGPRDLVLIDEAHLVPGTGDGMYRTLLGKLRERVPDLRVAGFTATPYRLGEGRLDKGDGRLFDKVVYSYGIAQGVRDGWLTPLVSKATMASIDVSGVARRGGEFVEADLQAAVDRSDITEAAADEIVALGEARRSWLLFCTGVDHAHKMREAMRRRGILCETVTGETPRAERDDLISAFRSGRIRCLTNANVLTTGFDAPGVDLIAMLRPTLSTGLYVQICGRGTRVVWPDGFDPNAATSEERLTAIAASRKAHCLVLDFAGNVRRHGPVDDINPVGSRRAAVDDEEEEPEIAVRIDTVRAKECPDCKTLLALRVNVCTTCGHEWERRIPKHEAKADEDLPIMKMMAPPPDPWTILTSGPRFAKHVKFGDPDAPPTLRVDYSAGLKIHSEWVCLEHQGFPRSKAERWWRDMHGQQPPPPTVVEALARIEAGELARPSKIVVRQEGKYDRIIGRWFEPTEIGRAKTFVYRPQAFAAKVAERAPWWTVLGIAQDAEEDDIRDAFRRLAREHHPDMGGDTAMMAQINRAHSEALRDVELRSCEAF